MCSRFDLSAPISQLNEQYGGLTDYEPRNNLSPSHDLLAVRQSPGDEPTWCRLEWGLLPWWFDKVTRRPINARAETVAAKPVFRDSFRRCRCLIPASGFYEWSKDENQLFRITPDDNSPLWFAGLYARWEQPGPTLDTPPLTVINSCAIITTTANATLRSIHDRMPVILPTVHQARWLDPTITNTEELQALMQPCLDELLTAYPVRGIVNDTSHPLSQ